MEGIENGYDLSPVYTHKRVYVSDSEAEGDSTRDHKRHDGDHKRRREEKRRRKEEKAARKAERAKRKSEAMRAEAGDSQPVAVKGAGVEGAEVEQVHSDEEAARKREKARRKELKAKRRKESLDKQREGEGDLSFVDDLVEQPDLSAIHKTSSPVRPSADPSSSRPTPNPSEFRAKKPRNSTASTKGKDKETDDELKAKFRAPGAMNAWLASQWHDLKELQRLEGLGILSYKRGRFNEEEKAAIKAHLGVFKRINKLDDDELVGVIMGKGRTSERKDFPKFWPEVAANAPGRPVKAVKDFVKREYDPRGNKGSWTSEEDAALLRAYQVHPNEWAKIAVIVDRTEMDCRDRYRNELAHKETRKTGHWEPAEERQLVDIIKEANEAVGNDPLNYEAPWEAVVQKMGGTRTRTQCRKKWQEQLRMIQMTRGGPTKLKSADRSLLVQRLKRLDRDSEAEVDWISLCQGIWNGVPPSSLRGLFWRMKNEVKGQEKMSFEDLLDELEKRYPVSSMSAQSTPRLKMLSKPEIESEEEM